MKNNIEAEAILTRNLLGKRLSGVKIHNSHGEVLELMFENGQTLTVCSTHGIADKSVTDDPNDIYLSLNEISL